MAEERKSRLAEILGVEKLELIRVKNIGGTKYVTKPFSVYEVEDGSKPWAYEAVIYAINHPESIIRAQRLTEAEIAIMRAVGAEWVSRDEGFDSVFLWSDKPRVSEDNEVYYLSHKLGDCIGSIRAWLFPSVHPGQCICVKDQIRLGGGN